MKDILDILLDNEKYIEVDSCNNFNISEINISLESLNKIVKNMNKTGSNLSIRCNIPKFEIYKNKPDIIITYSNIYHIFMRICM